MIERVLLMPQSIIEAIYISLCNHMRIEYEYYWLTKREKKTELD